MSVKKNLTRVLVYLLVRPWTTTSLIEKSDTHLHPHKYHFWLGKNHCSIQEQQSIFLQLPVSLCPHPPCILHNLLPLTTKFSNKVPGMALKLLKITKAVLTRGLSLAKVVAFLCYDVLLFTLVCCFSPWCRWSKQRNELHVWVTIHWELPSAHCRATRRVWLQSQFLIAQRAYHLWKATNKR